MMERADFNVIEHWITPHSRILDLACGDGTLLNKLIQNRHVSGYGLEINGDNINSCLKVGVNVIEHNLDQGLTHLKDNSFDTVIMTQALQVMRYPHRVLDEMLRVGKECVVTFPNFGHWQCRLQLLVSGRMPVSNFMPYSWFDTPNIHFCTFRDFEILCRQKKLTVLNRLVVDQSHNGGWQMRLFPNLMGKVAIYHLTKSSY